MIINYINILWTQSRKITLHTIEDYIQITYSNAYNLRPHTNDKLKGIWSKATYSDVYEGIQSKTTYKWRILRHTIQKHIQMTYTKAYNLRYAKA